MFRKEAIEAKRNKLTGNVIIVQPLSLQLICIIIFIIIILVLSLLFNSSYTRKETVKGYVVPQNGVIKIYPLREGIISEIYVSEGSKVNGGDDIIRISNRQNLSNGLELTSAMKNELESQIKSLTSELDLIKKINKKEMVSIEKQMSELRNSYNSIKNAKLNIKERVLIKKEIYDRNRELYKKGFISNSHLVGVKDEYLVALQAYDLLEKDENDISLEISRLSSEKLTLPENKSIKEIRINRQISNISSQIIGLNSQLEVVQKAPSSGIITTIQPTIGSKVNSNTPVLSIIPDNSTLEVELLLPTRSAGFVQLGNEVNVRFDAFPYQKFGLVSGKVSKVDRDIILPQEQKLPININQPMYRVRATINKNNVTAYGNKFPIKIGMLVDADISLEKRTLLEWFLEPLYSFRGRL